MNIETTAGTVRLEGPLTVAHAETIQTRLLDALSGGEPVVIDLSAATDIDVSFLQILVAAQKSAAASRTTLHVARDGAQRLMDEAARCGLSATATIHGTKVLPGILQGAA